VFSYKTMGMGGYAAASMFPEWMVALLGGVLGGVLAMGLWGLNAVAGLYYHLKHIPALFRAAQSDDKDAGWQNPEDVSYIRPWKAAMACGYALLSFITLFVLPPCVTLSTLLTPLFATYAIHHAKKTGEEKGRVCGWSTYWLDELKYKRTFLMLLSSLVVASDVNTYIGSDIAAGLFVATGLAATFTPVFQQTVNVGDGFAPLPDRFVVHRNKISV